MKKHRLFPFLTIDYRAAEAWRNERAGEGLLLRAFGDGHPLEEMLARARAMLDAPPAA